MRGMRLLALLGTVLAVMTASASASTLAVCVEGAPDTFNPEINNNGTTIGVTAQIYDELVEIDPGTSKLQPGLAKSWSASTDGKTYTFRLRHGVKWQSNDAYKPTRDFDADDVVFTFERMMDPENPYHSVDGGTYPTFEGRLADVLESVTKVDDYTVRFTLKEPLAAFIAILAHQSLAITSAEYAKAMRKAGRPSDFDGKPIGTGPFSLVAYQAGAVVRFAAFQDTWGKKTGDKARTPMVDNLVLAVTTDPAVRLERLKADECQVALYPNPGDSDSIRKDPALRLIATPTASVGFITFNVKDKPFQNPDVRKALAMAIDLEPLVKAVYEGTGSVTAALVPKVLWGHNSKIRPVAYDPKKAKALLAKAGYPNGFDTDLWAVPVSRPYMPHGKRAAEIIQQDFAAIGVHAKIVTYEWGEYIKRAVAGESKIGMFGGIWDYPDPSEIPNNYFTCTNGKPSPSNIGRWCNPEFNRLMHKAGQLTDQKKRAQLYEQAQKVFNNAHPAVILGSQASFTAVSKSVQGLKPAVFGATLFSGVTVKD